MFLQQWSSPSSATQDLVCQSLFGTNDDLLAVIRNVNNRKAGDGRETCKQTRLNHWSLSKRHPPWGDSNQQTSDISARAIWRKMFGCCFYKYDQKVPTNKHRSPTHMPFYKRDLRLGLVFRSRTPWHAVAAQGNVLQATGRFQIGIYSVRELGRKTVSVFQILIGITK